jgi:hypothetical protein
MTSGVPRPNNPGDNGKVTVADSGTWTYLDVQDLIQVSTMTEWLASGSKTIFLAPVQFILPTDFEIPTGVVVCGQGAVLVGDLIVSGAISRVKVEGEISLQAGARISDCEMNGCQVLGTGVMISGCKSTEAMNGFTCVDGEAVIVNCEASDNDEHGFIVDYATLIGCHGEGNGTDLYSTTVNTKGFF